jgi:hypothetical protein
LASIAQRLKFSPQNPPLAGFLLLPDAGPRPSGWRRVWDSSQRQVPGQGSITARDCPHIAEEFLAEEREGMSEWQFRADYLCEFTETDEAFFSSELCDAMIDKTLEAWA